MAHYEFNGSQFYIDGILKEELERKVLPQLMKHDKDYVLLIDGRERTGKSKFADLLGGFAASVLGTPYDISNVCMTPEEFRNKVMNCPNRSVVIYDEAHRGMASSRALSEINNILKDMMMEMGQKNLFVIIVLPTFFLLDRYAALFRSSGLFHVYENRKKERGYWVFFNEKQKMLLYFKGKKELNYNCMRWPRHRGRFLNQYVVSEEEYREKKGKSFKEKPRSTKSEKYRDERNKIIRGYAKDYKKSQRKLVRRLKKWGVKISKTTILEILREKTEKEG